MFWHDMVHTILGKAWQFLKRCYQTVLLIYFKKFTSLFLSFVPVLVLGIESRVLHMVGKHFTTELCL